MIVCLSNGIAVTVIFLSAELICLFEKIYKIRVVGFKPEEQGGTEIKIYIAIIIGYIYNSTVVSYTLAVALGR
jgi:hypothetical protein